MQKRTWKSLGGTARGKKAPSQGPLVERTNVLVIQPESLKLAAKVARLEEWVDRGKKQAEDRRKRIGPGGPRLYLVGNLLNEGFRLCIHCVA